MVIFRENTEDIYAGIEFEAGQRRRRKKIIDVPAERVRGVKKIRFPDTLGHRHQAGLAAKAPSAWSARRSSTRSTTTRVVTLVHKGNIMKFTEGAFRDWGYELAQKEFGAELRSTAARGASSRTRRPGKRHHRSRTSIADIILQQVLTAPGRVRRHRHPEPQRRLPLRCARRPGRRHRHRAGRQHQYDRPRHVRGDPRHRAEVRRQGQGQPGLA